MNLTRFAAPALLAALLTTTAAESAAQACTGVAIERGRTAVLAGAGLAADGGLLSAGAHANLPGRAAVAGTYTLRRYDAYPDAVNTVAIAGAAELMEGAVSVCPRVGLEYTLRTRPSPGFDVDETEIVLPLGVGVGFARALTVHGAAVSPYLIPSLLVVHTTADRQTLDGRLSDTYTDLAAGAQLGVSVSVGRFLAGAAMSGTSMEDGQPVLSVSGGLSF
jgi:hypothetical protein